jgi:hypothetical protein
MVRKVRPIADITSTALRKEEMVVHLQAIQDEYPSGESNVAYRSIAKQRHQNNEATAAAMQWL